jgi:hypothetical protein
MTQQTVGQWSNTVARARPATKRQLEMSGRNTTTHARIPLQSKVVGVKLPKDFPEPSRLLTQIFRQTPCYGIPIFCGAINFTNLNATRRRFVSKNWHTKTRSTRTFSGLLFSPGIHAFVSSIVNAVLQKTTHPYLLTYDTSNKRRRHVELFAENNFRNPPKKLK